MMAESILKNTMQFSNNPKNVDCKKDVKEEESKRREGRNEREITGAGERERRKGGQRTVGESVKKKDLIH